MGSGRTTRDEIGDRFGLRQIQFSIQKGAKRILSRFSQPCPLLAKRLQKSLDEWRTMTGKFQVSSPVGVRTAKNGNENFVQDRIVEMKFTEVQAIARLVLQRLY